MKITKTTLYSSALFLGILASVTMTHASIMTTNYGDFSATIVEYLQVTESSSSATTALYGRPTVSGDTLDFDPNGFAASANGGSDTTIGSLAMDVVTHSGYVIEQLRFDEAGDFSLLGFGSDATYVDVSATFYIDILEVDGDAISTLSTTNSMTFNPNPDGTFALLTDGGGGPFLNGVWAGSSTIDINALLAQNTIAYTEGATKIRIKLDNVLNAVSESGTQALIAKKDFSEFSITATIPEPASLGLLAITSSMIAYIRYKFVI